MLDHTTPPPIGIHLLADHLDATLAAGEDLMALRLEPAADLPEGEMPEERLAAFVADVRQHEAALLLRLLQARRRAEAVVNTDFAVKTVLKLIAAGTASLVDLARAYGEQGREGVASGDDLQHVLRQRGLIAEDSPCVGAFQTIRVDDTFRIGGVVPIGGLLDLAASALDLLDRHYNLYQDDDLADTVPDPAPSDLQTALDAVAHLKKASIADTAPDTAKLAEPTVAPADEAETATETESYSAGSLQAALAELNSNT